MDTALNTSLFDEFRSIAYEKAGIRRYRVVDVLEKRL